MMQIEILENIKNKIKSKILRRNIDDALALEKVGQNFHTTAERIKLIEQKAIAKLRHPKRK
jgi:DNA-directed RNA polymerase sigma subunit (sigma70/sigma32)